jgi:single-stranded DNA-binding protein
MRGVNRVVISGNCQGRVNFSPTDGKGTPACSFYLTSDRHSHGDVVSVNVKINAYGDGLVRACRARLTKGLYVLVEGELMNRDGQIGELTEVRAREIIFIPRDGVPKDASESLDAEGGHVDGA